MRRPITTALFAAVSLNACALAATRALRLGDFTVIEACAGMVAFYLEAIGI
jgi:hypothetical protein